jgi:curved DNA-binding protein CbpA
MQPPPQEEFVDYYELLQISPNAEPETIQRVYRMLAARYHPDNPETGDTVQFVRLNEAHRVLSNLELRAGYDFTYRMRHSEPLSVFEMKEFMAGIDGEANRRMGILCLLYHKRRTNPDSGGISILQFETMMALPREHLLFTVWYLKEKKLIRQEENSDFVIGSDGVDYVESHLSSHQVLYKLLKAAETGSSRSSPPQHWSHPGSDAESRDVESTR